MFMWFLRGADLFFLQLDMLTENDLALFAEFLSSKAFSHLFPLLLLGCD